MPKSTRHFAFTALALTSAGLAWTSALASPVRIESGLIEGQQAGSVHVFKGIPYAAPPVGELRWKPPQPAHGWSGVRQATAFSPACPQVGRYPPDAKDGPTSEDCLTLNVWVPATTTKQPLPVMVWIHGGSLLSGSGALAQYDGSQLAKHGVIVVTINYRLGVLGFLSHPELNRESPYGTSGNYGLLDQIAALQWVHRNIAALGGDSSRVTIFGQSSGAFSVSMLTATPLAKGLFQRAIAQSGGVFEPVELDASFTPAGAAEIGKNFAKRVGASSLAELRRMPVEQLLKTRFNPQFNIDGHVIPLSPRDAYARHKINRVDLLLGSNASEATSFFDAAQITRSNFAAVLEKTYPALLLRAIGAAPGDSDTQARSAAIAIDTDLRFRWDMWSWARNASASGERVFLYRFARQAAYRHGHPYFGLGATHGAELPYLFGQLDPASGNWTDGDHQLSSAIQQYWTNFARTGNPHAAELVPWPAFDASHHQELELDTAPHAAEVPDAARLERIDRVYGIAAWVSAHPLAALAGLLAGFGIGLTLLFRSIRAVLRARRKGHSARHG